MQHSAGAALQLRSLSVCSCGPCRQCPPLSAAQVVSDEGKQHSTFVVIWRRLQVGCPAGSPTVACAHPTLNPSVATPTNGTATVGAEQCQPAPCLSSPALSPDGPHLILEPSCPSLLLLCPFCTSPQARFQRMAARRREIDALRMTERSTRGTTGFSTPVRAGSGSGAGAGTHLADCSVQGACIAVAGCTS